MAPDGSEVGVVDRPSSDDVDHLVPALGETGDRADSSLPPPAPSGDAVRADEVLPRILLSRMRRWFEEFVTPAERVRLDRDYADLCPDSGDPISWYLIRRAAATPALRRRRWVVMSPAAIVGAAINPVVDELGLINGSLLLPVLAGWLLFVVYHFGEFLKRLGQVRRAGLFQSLLLAGERPHTLANVILTRAKIDTSPLVTLVIAGGVAQRALAGLFGVTDAIILVVAVVVMFVGGIPGLAFVRWDRAAGDPDDRGVRLLLGIGLKMSRHTAAVPRWMLGLVFWGVPLGGLAVLIAVGNLALYVAVRLTASNSVQIAFLLVGLLMSSLLLLRFVERIIAWNEDAAAVEEDIGQSP